MSNRRRLPRTARSPRIVRRPPVSRIPASRWLGQLRRWSALPWPLPVLAVAAEVGHLAAAFLEWPGAPVRGLYHVVAAGLLGLVAAAWSGPRRPGLGWAATAAAAVALSGPVAWLGGALAGATPYAALPVSFAGVIILAEVSLAALLLGARPAGHTTAEQPAGPVARGQRSASRAAG